MTTFKGLYSLNLVKHFPPGEGSVEAVKNTVDGFRSLLLFALTLEPGLDCTDQWGGSLL